MRHCIGCNTKVDGQDDADFAMCEECARKSQ